MKRVKTNDLINSKFLYLLTHIKYRSLNNISYLHLGSGHYLWGGGRGGAGKWGNGTFGTFRTPLNDGGCLCNWQTFKKKKKWSGAKRKAKQRKEKRKRLCQAAVVESLTGQSAEEVILPLSDDMIYLQNTDSLHPTILVKGLDQLISESGLSVGAASEIQTYLTSKSIEWNPFAV